MGRSKESNRKRDAARRQRDEENGIVRHPPARSFLYPTREQYQSIFRILPSADPMLLEFEMIPDWIPDNWPPWRPLDLRRDRPPPNHGRERWKEIVAVPDGPPRILSSGPVRASRVPPPGRDDSNATDPARSAHSTAPVSRSARSAHAAPTPVPGATGPDAGPAAADPQCKVEPDCNG
ncbi:hypothetical protein GGF32_001401 [Allomyces javanicus]|nr:hypothetical protein GGF32_001401 [Allomyces javanicus]